MHIGTFAAEGSWGAAMGELPALAELGITCIEIMPVAEFPGRFGWGYDGVGLFAPTRLYGGPIDFRRFVDCAHALGIAVILDVVYNHIGPDGNYLKNFSPAYFSDHYDGVWGDAINFDGPDSGPVREFFIANAGYWIDEYHLDGLRLDATQEIFDRSEDHILAAIVRQSRSAGRGRTIFIVGENETQEARLARAPDRGGYGLDALWNDDFHHSAMVALTGRREAYYSGYRGRSREFVAAAKHGFLYQGQRYQWQQKPRGTPALDLSAESFVVFLQNHDQIANSGTGERCHALTSPGRLRAMTAYFLLMPGIPMLFQGQEFGASTGRKLIKGLSRRRTGWPSPSERKVQYTMFWREGTTIDFSMTTPLSSCRQLGRPMSNVKSRNRPFSRRFTTLPSASSTSTSRSLRTTIRPSGAGWRRSGSRGSAG